WPSTEKSGELSIATAHLLYVAETLAGMKSLLTILATKKMLSTFGEDYVTEHVRNGRLYPKYNIGGAKTGRFSSKEPNIQQLPSRKSSIRRCVIAKPGYVLIEGDFSQIELRAVAEVADIAAMRQMYVEGRDLHCESASRVHGDTVAKDDPRRRVAKG